MKKQNPSLENAWGEGGSFFGLIFRPFIFILKVVSMTIFPLIAGIFKTIVFVLYLPLELILKATPLGLLLSRLTHEKDTLGQLERESQKLAENPDLSEGEALLIQDQRLKYAELVAPKDKYPSLYKTVPEDLVRSVVADGRMVTGEAPATALAGLKLTPEFVTKAWVSSTRIAVRIGYLVAVAGIALAAYASYQSAVRVGQMTHTSAGVVATQRLDTASLASGYADIWSPEQETELLAKINVVDLSDERAAGTKAKTALIVQGVVMFALLLVAVLLFAGAAARIVWIGRFRYLVHAAVDASVNGLRHSWREALQRWRWRLPEREMELANYIDQVNFATVIDKSPLLDIGTSLGLLEHRGHLLAPAQHQPVRMSVADMLQHVEVLGGSGEGKSRNFYIPLVHQLLKLRKQGYPIALYATDDKGAIGADILQAAKEVGLPDGDILVIGTGPDDYRVDLLAGLEPVEVADIIKSVAKQAGGESSDDFWPDMASDLLLQVAVVLQAAEFTASGEAWVAKSEMRMYSLLNILRVASSDVEIEKALQIVLNALQDRDDQYRRVAHLDKNGLKAAIDYLVENWLSMVDATKDGIRANARKALRSFAFKDEIARGFADGAGDKIIPASEIISNKIKIINVSQIEHGSAGRMVSIMLKTLLFKQARQSEQRDPLFAKERLNWWFNPKLGPDTDKYAINVFLADEYQGIVTSSRDDGLSDATVWNVLRSAGIAGVLLSQSVSAYRMAVGDKATDNMRRNWRTKIILRTEDLPTIEEAKKLAGKTMRFQSMSWEHMESAVAVRRETNVCAENLPPVAWNPEMDEIPLFFTPGHYSGFNFSGYQQAYQIDQRFIAQDSILSQDSSRLGSMQAAAWRQEDRTMSVLQHGSSEVEAVRDEDLMTMGRARALVFVQRAGGTRVEFVKLNG